MAFASLPRNDHRSIVAMGADGTMEIDDRARNGSDRRIALLIDADNVPHSKIADMLAELSKYGTANIRRAYGNRAKSGPYRFHLARMGGEPVGYGALVAAPSGAGMIEDLFTLPAYRKRGIASAMIAQFSTALEEQGCTSIFLGALVNEQARHLYAKLGFRPEMLTRCWVRRAT